MAELLDETNSLESTTVGIYRTAKTVKGGRNFSFAALVVVGDRNGRVGIGYAKAPQVPTAIEKAQKVGKRSLKTYPMQGRTIPHVVNGSFLASKIRLVPASPGTGVIAGASVRAVLEMFGIQDCLTKCYGSTNAKNLVKATLDALSQLQLRSQIEALRGIELGETEVEEAVRRGMAFMPQEAASERAKAPVNTVGEDRRRGGRRGGGGGRRGGGGGGGRDGGGAPASAQASKAETPAAPKAEAPAADAPAPPADGGGENAG